MKKSNIDIHKVIIYDGADEEEELEILIPYDEMKKAVEETQWWKNNCADEQFTPICDWCANADKVYSFFPELGHKVMCQKCAKDHKKTVQWYTEDLHPVFDSLISWMKTYNLGWSEIDYAMVDEFFSSKGHYSLHIKKFMGD